MWPNQVKWATFSCWFQWNHLIYFPLSVFGSQYYFTNNNSYSSCSSNLTYSVFDFSIFYTKLVDCIFFQIVEQHVWFVKDRETCGNGERNIKISVFSSNVSQIISHCTLKSTKREVLTKCGEPVVRNKSVQ